ncbi:MAG: ABC transporter substrate-binding protein [Alphaproteobacteria bacterium]|nr:ABC transporter substrate-binding protein [Alphaproteobacteria bacterium]
MTTKRFSKSTLLALTTAILVSGAYPAQAFIKGIDHNSQTPLTLHVADDAHVQGAQNFIDGVAKRGIGFLSNESLSEAQREKEFRQLLNDSFDMNTIARFALGRYWKSASEAQKKEYLKLFQAMIVEVYTARFSEYNGQALEVVSARGEGDSDAIVTSKIVPAEGKDVQVDWRVRHKNGRYKVVDVVVEGVSMALTQRSDFASVIQRGGGNVEVLLEHLRAS